MGLRDMFERSSQGLADLWFSLLPQPRPSMARLQNCKIVSHRGAHDNSEVRENTMAAFERVRDAGIWGIELDVRWTLDLEPVVIHDENTHRVFGLNIVIAQHKLQDLRQQIPLIPTLAEVVQKFGGKTHLMVELKPDVLGKVEQKRERLQAIFAPIIPAQDFHFIALDLGLFDMASFVGDSACVPVAELNVNAMSRETLQRPFAGISGQYLLLHRRMIRRHQQRQQNIGTGFTASRYCLYRELNRGVDWIFTNHALKLRAILLQLLRDS